MASSNRVAILGEGRLALALAHLIAERGDSPHLFAPGDARRRHLKKTRQLKKVVPELEAFHEGVVFVDSLAELAAASRLIIYCGVDGDPTKLIDELGEALTPAHQVCHADHRLFGPELLTTSALIRRRTSLLQLGALAGPLHVGELLGGQPNAVEVASAFPDLVRRVGRALDWPHLRIYSTADLQGAEVGAALVEVVALAIGTADAFGAGAATNATITVRGLAEMRRLGEALGAQSDSFNGLACLGKLIDSTRRGSADYELGGHLANGVVGAELTKKAGPEARSLGIIPLVRAFADGHGIRVPITATLDELVAGRITSAEVLKLLTSGPGQ